MTAKPSTTLLMSWRTTNDNQLLWRAAVKRGWQVERVQGIRVPALTTGRVFLYLESLFAQTVAKQLRIQLVELTNDWLTTLPPEYLRREVRLTTLANISQSELPLFLKPPNEKSFPARVYGNIEQLLAEYDPATVVLTANPVAWEVEFRCFCLDRRVRTLSPYLRRGVLSELDGFSATDRERSDAQSFAERFLQDERINVPRAIVLDVGTLVDGTWAIVEANAAWGSGIYGCDPDEVLNVLEYATVPQCHERPND